MGNSLRCCLACVLPFGALDLIRIVHLNGRVEEISHPISAGEILKANPNHVLSRPCSQGGGTAHKILILSHESELKRGGIYFLIPNASLPENQKRKHNNEKRKDSSRRSKRSHNQDCDRDQPEKKLRLRKECKKTGHDTVWQPHLHSITED